MKRKKFYGVAIIVLVVLFSCSGNSIKSDAKRVADIENRAMKLMSKATAGDQAAMAEYTKLAADAAALTKEMQGKYTSDSDKKKFEEALAEALTESK